MELVWYTGMSMDARLASSEHRLDFLETLGRGADVVEASWRIAAPILDVWGSLPPRDFPNYAAGTWGPREADELLLRDGRRWVNG